MKRLLYLLIPVLILGAMVFWRLRAKQDEKQQQESAAAARKNAAPNVNGAPAAIRDIVLSYDGVGSVEAPFNVKIASRLTGLITYLQVREGAAVKAGDVVARIDPSAAQALVSQYRASVAEAQSRLAQASVTANAAGVSVESQVVQQAAALNTSRANYGQVRGNFEATVSAAQAAVTDARGKVASAQATIANTEAMIRSAQANVSNARTRYTRTNSLYQSGFVAAQDVDDARTTVNVQIGALNVAQAQRDAAVSALSSAQAQLKAAQENVGIVTRKGQADIEAAASAVKQSQAALQYARANTSQKPAYQANLQALRAAVTAAQSQLQSAEAQRNDTVLRSTVTGFVSARYADPGAVVNAGSPIISIQSEKQVFVDVGIPEEITRSVHAGEPATAVFDAFPGQNFMGTIAEINPAADPQSRQFTLRVTLANAQNLIKPGMFGRVKFETLHIHDAVVVPREAVKNGKSGPTVAVIGSDGVVHVRKVAVGAQDTKGIQILNGVQPGESVVTLSLMPALDGKKVKVTPSAVATGGAEAAAGG